MAEPETPLFRRKALVGGSEEDTPGTAKTISAALVASSIYDAVCEPLDMHGDSARQPQGHYLGSVAAMVGKRLGRLTFRMPMRYGDQALPMLTGAGFKLDTGTYKPTSDWDSRKTWTLALWEDGRKKQIHGATCDVRFEWGGGVGREVWATFEWTGVWDAPTDQAMPAQAPSVHTTAYYVSRGATFTIAAAAAPLIGSGSVMLNNTIEEREDITSTTGVLHTFVGARDPQIRLPHEARLVADGAPYADLIADTEEAFSLAFTDEAGSPKTLTIAAPKIQKIAVADGERNQKRLDDVTYRCNASSGDDELTFAAA